MPIIRLEKLLKSGTHNALDKIVQTAQNIDELTSALRRQLEPELGANLVAANLHPDGDLVLVASSSAWASKLRFESETLIAAARETGAEVNRCRVSVSRHSVK